jgi:dihydroneopterin aldolase/2-amino-4-hydroxy-6-hydroxymethyldihydropteridine diphosphokinase/dihydropteroate synthase
MRTVNQLLSFLENTDDYVCSCIRVIPLRTQIVALNGPTIIMGVVNVTPDSFSDGGLYCNVEDAVTQSMKLISEGASILDIGGQSTRPNAIEITAQEEIERVVPVIKAIRERDCNIAISVDTFRASVARACINAGADIINDVSGGSRDNDMLTVMAELNVPVVLMHMRGNSTNMMSLTNYDDDVVKNVREALIKTVKCCLDAGVYLWNVIIDPGLGFAKTCDQNYDLISNLRSICSGSLEGLPLLVGPSRKRFIGEVICKDVAIDRQWGTAASCVVCVSGGANILRVHDVKEMRDVLLVADRCYKR